MEGDTPGITPGRIDALDPLSGTLYHLFINRLLHSVKESESLINEIGRPVRTAEDVVHSARESFDTAALMIGQMVPDASYHTRLIMGRAAMTALETAVKLVPAYQEQQRQLREWEIRYRQWQTERSNWELEREGLVNIRQGAENFSLGAPHNVADSPPGPAYSPLSSGLSPEPDLSRLPRTPDYPPPEPPTALSPTPTPPPPTTEAPRPKRPANKKRRPRKTARPRTPPTPNEQKDDTQPPRNKTARTAHPGECLVCRREVRNVLRFRCTACKEFWRVLNLNYLAGKTLPNCGRTHHQQRDGKRCAGCRRYLYEAALRTHCPELPLRLPSVH